MTREESVFEDLTQPNLVWIRDVNTTRRGLWIHIVEISMEIDHFGNYNNGYIY